MASDRLTTVMRFAAAAMVACLAAWAGGCLGFAAAVALTMEGSWSDTGNVGVFVLIYGVVVLPVVSAITLVVLPPVVALLAVARRRGFVAYALTGAASGAAVAVLWITSGVSELVLVPQLGVACVAAGACAGAAFWGVNRPDQRAAAPSGPVTA